MLFNVSNKDILLILSTCHWYFSIRIRNSLQHKHGGVNMVIKWSPYCCHFSK